VSKETSLGLKVTKYLGDQNIIKQTPYRVIVLLSAVDRVP